MNLKTATMIAMLGIGLALGLRFVLLLTTLVQFASPSRGMTDLPFSILAQTVLHFVTDLLAYVGLLVFLFALWTKQRPGEDA
ncbi:MAG: hypothetical protein KF708_21860 [Pirellulales bacterium]|nr:hypothetical protein [Pirellulales bacterium]